MHTDEMHYKMDNLAWGCQRGWHTSSGLSISGFQQKYNKEEIWTKKIKMENKRTVDYIMLTIHLETGVNYQNGINE